MSTPEAEKEKATAAAEKAAADNKSTRVLIEALAVANLCIRRHAVAQRKIVSPSGNPKLAEAMREAKIIEPDPSGCPECAARLSPASACMLLATLRTLGVKGGATDFVRAAISLKSEQPMAWASVDRQDAIGVHRAFDRCGVKVDPGKLQSEAEAIARVVSRKAA